MTYLANKMLGRYLVSKRIIQPRFDRLFYSLADQERLPPIRPNFTPLLINGSVYNKCQKIYQGPASAVYSAICEGKKYIIKQINLENDESKEAAFAEIAANIRLAHCGKHSSLITYQINRNYCYLVFEFENGSELSRFLPDNLPPEYADKLKLFLPICKSVKDAHDASVLHLDLKPRNIRFLYSGIARLLDFGAALIFPDGKNFVKRQHFYGSDGYASPEQVRAEELDERADIFSLGALLCQFVSSTLPFPGTGEEYIRAVLYSDPISLSNIPDSLSSLVYTCLEKDPKNRFRNVAELIKEVERVVSYLS